LRTEEELKEDLKANQSINQLTNMKAKIKGFNAEIKQKYLSWSIVILGFLKYFNVFFQQ
tara:strand:+ start:13 stop:189 length:177 start_codon:yes stop_codon:yes gene_type:complete